LIDAEPLPYSALLGEPTNMRTASILLIILLSTPTAAMGQESEARKKFFVGADMVDLGDYAGAIQYLNEALDLDPEMCNAHRYLSEAYLGIGDATSFEKARKEALAYKDCASVDVIMDVEDLLQRIEEEAPRYNGWQDDDERDLDPERQDPEDIEPEAAQDETADSGAGESSVDQWMNDGMPGTARVGVAAWSPRRKLGLGLMVGGFATGAGGFIANIAIANEGWKNQDDDDFYEWSRVASNGFLVMGIVGVSVGAAGLVLALIPDKNKQAGFLLVPGPVPTLMVRF